MYYNAHLLVNETAAKVLIFRYMIDTFFKEEQQVIHMFHDLLMTSFQILVKATDGGTPAKVSQQATVSVTVTRNTNSPQWTGRLPYTAAVNENQGTNSKIFSVTARDRDPAVSHLQLWSTLSCLNWTKTARMLKMSAIKTFSLIFNLFVHVFYDVCIII